MRPDRCRARPAAHTGPRGEIGVLGGVDPARISSRASRLARSSWTINSIDLGPPAYRGPAARWMMSPAGPRSSSLVGTGRARWSLSGHVGLLLECLVPPDGRCRATRPGPNVPKAGGEGRGPSALRRRGGSGPIAGAPGVARRGRRADRGHHRRELCMTATEHEERSRTSGDRGGRHRRLGSLPTGPQMGGRRGTRRPAPSGSCTPNSTRPRHPPAWYKPGDSWVVGSGGRGRRRRAGGHPPPLPDRPGRGGRVARGPGTHQCQPDGRTAGGRGPGMGGFRELLLGSIGDQCIQYAHCPVAVVHGASDDPAFESASPAWWSASTDHRVGPGPPVGPGRGPDPVGLGGRRLRLALPASTPGGRPGQAVPGGRRTMVATAVESAAHWEPDVSFRAASGPGDRSRLARRITGSRPPGRGIPGSRRFPRGPPGLGRSSDRPPRHLPGRRRPTTDRRRGRRSRGQPVDRHLRRARSPLPLRWGCRAGDRRGR